MEQLTISGHTNESLKYWPQYKGWVLESLKDDALGDCADVSYSICEPDFCAYVDFSVRGNAKPEFFRIFVSANPIELIGNPKGETVIVSHFNSFLDIEHVLNKALILLRGKQIENS